MTILKVLGITIGVFFLAVFAAPFVLGVTAVALISGSKQGRTAIEMARAEHEMEKAKAASGSSFAGDSERDRLLRQVIVARAEAERHESERLREDEREREYQRPAEYTPGQPMSSAEPSR